MGWCVGVLVCSYTVCSLIFLMGYFGGRAPFSMCMLGVYRTERSGKVERERE